MHFATANFGVIEFDESTVLHFPQGLPGFEACQRFKLLHEAVEQPKVLWLQSLDDGDICFSVVEASMLGVNYRIELSDDERALLANPGPGELLLLLTLSKPNGRDIRANTQSPILVNPAVRVGLQKVALHAEIVFTSDEPV